MKGERGPFAQHAQQSMLTFVAKVEWLAFVRNPKNGVDST